jgi:RNA-directed DNA polymerase
MMHGTKKSHSSIVPAKPANKAEQSAAESVEGDDGTKRNAELQSTVRTQGREAVSQAQDRIREAVNRNKKEKLTALLHHVSVDVLRWAFFNLKKQAAPGIDGLTWVDYAADLERNLTDLHARVHSGAYRALRSRRRYIPKADGKQSRSLSLGNARGSGNPLPQLAVLPVGDGDRVGRSRLSLVS